MLHSCSELCVVSIKKATIISCKLKLFWQFIVLFCTLFAGMCEIARCNKTVPKNFATNLTTSNFGKTDQLSKNAGNLTIGRSQGPDMPLINVVHVWLLNYGGICGYCRKSVQHWWEGYRMLALKWWRLRPELYVLLTLLLTVILVRK